MIELKDYILGIDGKHEGEVLEATVELGVRTKKWLEDHGFKQVDASQDIVKATQTNCDRRTGEMVTILHWYLPLKNGNILVAKTWGKNVEHFTQWRDNGNSSYSVAKRYGADGYAKTPKEMDELWNKFIKKLV